MFDYEKLRYFFSKQSEKSEEDEKIVLGQLWKEKRILIDEFLLAYSSILEGFWYKENSNFESELNKFVKINTTPNDARNIAIKEGDYTDNEIHILEQKAQLLYNEDFLIAAYQQMLSPNYDPITLDLVIIRDHLWALLNLYYFMPEMLGDRSISVTLLTKFDVATLKLFAIGGQIMMRLCAEGNYFDYEQKRHKAIRRGMGTGENKRKILEAYKLISINGQSKHGAAVQIQEILDKKYVCAPGKKHFTSLDTIKRRLKEKKLPPFG